MKRSIIEEQIKNINSNDLYWIAGLLEGEGSFMKPPPSSPNVLRICIIMTDEDVIKKFSDLVYLKSYCTIRPRKSHWKVGYRADVKGYRAMYLMKTLKPLMGIRRQAQIDRAISFYDDKKFYFTNSKNTIEEVREIKRRILLGQKDKTISKEMNIKSQSIADIRRGKAFSVIEI